MRPIRSTDARDYAYSRPMSIIEAIILGVIEGVTEFLPISSTGHLTIAEEALGFNIDDADITAFTAIIQVGAVAAAFIYFWADLRGIIKARRRRRDAPRASLDAASSTTGSRSPIGSIPIAVVALIFRDAIEGDLRNLWVVAAGADRVELRDVQRGPVGDPAPRRGRLQHARRGGHGADPVRRPDPGRLAVRGDDRRRAASAASTGSRSPGCRSSSRSLR